MKTRIKKWRLIAVVVTLALIGAIPIFVYQLQQGVKAAYYEWGMTCIIIAYADDHNGELPTSWDDLAGYEHRSKYLPTPQTFESAAQFVTINFDALRDFNNNQITALPADVIETRRGIESHWVHPKAALERYFTADKSLSDDHCCDNDQYMKSPAP